jgi:membrane-bound lytic murein transglycosylase A
MLLCHSLHRRLAALAILGLLGACTSPPPHPPLSPQPHQAAAAATIALPPAALAAPSPERRVLQRERARWVAAEWAELPGWGEDRALDWWPALLRSCERPAPGWADWCAQARRLRPSDDWEAHLWLIKTLQPYRVESLEGEREGLVTGYFEPQLEARRQPQAGYRVPLLAPPADLSQRRPYDTRQQIEAGGRLQRLGLAWVQDPLDALVMQIQGSGRLRITEADGSARWVRLAFAGHNDQPYKSVGQWLIAQGELRPGEASWPGIKDWARRNPQRLQEALWSNPRYVFFREEPLPDPELGPRGAQGVALTPGRSIAVDKASIPYGTPVWLDATEPLSSTPLRRLVMAQDTGSAIVGAVRADFFWGWGAQAEAQAGRMKQPLRLWVLWPREG